MYSRRRGRKCKSAKNKKEHKVRGCSDEQRPSVSHSKCADVPVPKISKGTVKKRKQSPAKLFRKVANISKGAVKKRKRSPAKLFRKVAKISKGAVKKRKRSTAKLLGKVPKISKGTVKKRSPAKLFRKDSISETKLPESEDLAEEDYWLIKDDWKPDWDKGVQVPTKPDALLESNVIKLRETNEDSDFQLPSKLFRLTRDRDYDPDSHSLNHMHELSKFTCRYDLDNLDAHWLDAMNEDRSTYDMPAIDKGSFEIVMEKLEDLCHKNLQAALKTIGGANEGVVCDACQSPDSEDGNVIVFCEHCKICVHQSCYGITEVPEGIWICQTCSLGIRPSCVFCPNAGGAMKLTKTGDNWCHVSCAIWLPEDSFDSDKSKPIKKIPKMPMFRWSLQCVLCKVKAGACIQCSVMSCNVAYHVTCAFEVGLRMKGILSDDDDSVDWKSYCPQHTMGNSSLISDSEEVNENENVIEIVSAEKYEKLLELNANFFNYVSIDEIASTCKFDKDIIELVFNYWKMKRMANSNKALLPMQGIHEDYSSAQGNNTSDSIKNLMLVRKDLNRCKNLLYMINVREVLSKSFIKLKHDVFMKQVQRFSK